MINSELHFEPADPYLEEENILWQPRCGRDSSVDSWSLWPSGKAWSRLVRAPFNGDWVPRVFHLGAGVERTLQGEIAQLK